MRILIADDERMICEWLQFGIESNPDCELVGCAHNGEQALDLFEEKGADVVFTDIKMPVMDGLELLKRIKELSPETIVIMLTAFAEFDLAREAIRQGGDDYLLKTEMNHQMFQEVLAQIQMKVRRNKTEGHESIETESTGQQHSIISDILRDGRPLNEEDIKQLKECNIRWRDQGLFAVAICKKELKKDFTLPQNPLVHHVIGFDYDQFLYIIAGNLARDLSEYKKNQVLYEYASSIVRKNQCMAGLSSIIERLPYISDAIIQAAYGLGRGYYEGRIKVWKAEETGGKIRGKEAYWEEYYRKRRRELYELSGHSFYLTMEEVMDEAKRKIAVPIREFASFCCDSMEMAYMRFAGEDAQLMHHMLQEEKRIVRGAVDFQEVQNRVLEFIKNVLGYSEFDEKKLSKGVASAVSYVRKHYNEPISLESIAREANLNAEYLSRIFKEEVGCTYSAFLSEIRLKKAAYLLSHTTERVHKIAESVGYPNVSYFSTTFKKRYGVNPYEYRREVTL